MTSASVLELLDDLVRNGIRLEAADDRLLGTPPEALNAELRARIKQHRVELMELFATRENAVSASRGTDITAGSTLPSVSSAVHEADRWHCPPKQGCGRCGSREFVLLETESLWMCARCQPRAPGVGVTARWIDSAPLPVKTGELFDTREVHDDL